MPIASRTRLMIVDDHEIALVGLKVLISRHRNLECVGNAENSHQAFDLANRLRPDVIVMEVRMASWDGLEAIGRFINELPGTRVLVFSKEDAPSMVIAALRSGAVGYVSKSSRSMILMEAINAVAKGKRFIDPHLMDPFLRVFLDDQAPVIAASLSAREREILILIAWGFTNSVIGENLDLSTKTVECYRMRACEKLSLRDRPTIVKFAYMSGWMDESFELEKHGLRRRAEVSKIASEPKYC
jgi:DNA-binding NarL/FixJ family response regulator